MRDECECHGIEEPRVEKTTHTLDAPSFLTGGGEMGARMRAHDWTSSPLGSAHFWPQSLKTAIRIVLSSRYAMWMLWGPELTFFYNDAYKPTLGVKEAWALGSRSDLVWEEIWGDIGPRIDRVLRTGEATWDEALLLFLERSGFREETYHTFSYSPLANDAGAIVGMLCVVTEETDRIIGERRLRLLRKLGVRITEARTSREIWTAVEVCLDDEPHDLPWTLAYVFEGEGTGARLASTTHIGVGHVAAPARIDPGATHPWPLDHVTTEGDSPILCDIGRDHGDLPKGLWDESSSRALLLPIAAQGASRPIGAFVVGLNPYCALDADFEGFIKLFVGQIAAAIANVDAFEAERKRAEALAEIDRAKTTFFSNISHEFRTPLTLMLGPLEDLIGKPSDQLPPDARHLIGIAHRNGARLLRLVNALLDFSRIEAGRVQANYQPTDVSMLTADLASSFRSATDKVGLQLIVDCPKLSQPVHVDRDMWEKIVLNLISNAFKFTFDGEIAVVLHEAQDHVRLTVRDTGTGIPAEELPRLFERFHRVEGARGRSFEGSGIGLALVHELVRLHNGTIDVASEVGVGTTFSVILPRGEGPAAENRSPASRVSSTALRAQAFFEEALRWIPDAASDAYAGLGITPARPAERRDGGANPSRIVLADDNADLRDYIARLLVEYGYDVDVAANGVEALSALTTERPDLLITDVMMPQLDGFGLLHTIRNDPALRDLPVIMLSARAGEEAEIEGLDAGANDYLTKPFSARELLARVAANLAMARIRRDSTAALMESEARFRNMADHAPVMLWVMDDKADCVYVNRAWSDFTDQTQADALGFGWLQPIHPDDAVRTREMFLRASARHEPVRLEYRLRRLDGIYRWTIGAASPRFDSAGLFLGYIGSVIDITESKEAEAILARRVEEEVAARTEAEELLRQAQKMEAVGQLTGGLAHDFNNLLTGITGSLDLLSTRLAQGRLKELDRFINAAQGAASRAASLTHRLLAFSRRQTLDPRPTNVNRLVFDMEDLIRRTVGPATELEVVGAGGLWTALIDPHQLENALLNLCINARDAMPDGGRLTIETANKWLDDRAARDHEMVPGQYLTLCVTDTGTGMTPEVIRRAFDPFFTTKPIGQGTGLGLSMIYGFARQSGGTVRIYSEIQQGTTMCIYLPRHCGEAESDDREAVTISRPVSGDGETVLVVDDEPSVRMLVLEVLDDLGYKGLETVDGASGLKILQSNARIDLLITDVGLPGGMNGRQLADAARVERPALKVLFITGYAENAVIRHGHLDYGMRVTTKPFAMDALATQIKEMISGS